ncbi:MAG: hypothetical protein ACLR8P_02955 [Clostridium fessum]
MPAPPHTKVALGRRGRKLCFTAFMSNNNGSTIGHRHPGYCRRSRKNCQRPLTSPSSCSTGYGEALLKSALMLDEGEVETHLPLLRSGGI